MSDSSSSSDDGYNRGAPLCPPPVRRQPSNITAPPPAQEQSSTSKASSSHKTAHNPKSSATPVTKSQEGGGGGGAKLDASPFHHQTPAAQYFGTGYQKAKMQTPSYSTSEGSSAAGYGFPPGHYGRFPSGGAHLALRQASSSFTGSRLDGVASGMADLKLLERQKVRDLISICLAKITLSLSSHLVFCVQDLERQVRSGR